VDSSVSTSSVDSEKVNENRVGADSEIFNEKPSTGDA
jgi:hypothetical protein